MKLDIPIDWLEPDEDDLYRIELIDYEDGSQLMRIDILDAEKKEVLYSYYTPIQELLFIYQLHLFFPDVFLTLFSLFNSSPGAIKRLLNTKETKESQTKELEREGIIATIPDENIAKA